MKFKISRKQRYELHKLPFVAFESEKIELERTMRPGNNSKAFCHITSSHNKLIL